MHRDVRLPVGVEHLPVLGAGSCKIELEPDALAALSNRIPAAPAEMIDGTDQYVAQAPVLAIHAPALETRRAAAFNSRSQPHREFLLLVTESVAL